MPNSKKHTESKDTENPGKVDMGGNKGGEVASDRDPQGNRGGARDGKDTGKHEGDGEGTP